MIKIEIERERERERVRVEDRGKGGGERERWTENYILNTDLLHFKLSHPTIVHQLINSPDA